MRLLPRPMPAVRESESGFWRALREGTFVGQACRCCGRVRYPATLHCPGCRSTDAALRTLSGHGEIVSACRFHRAYFAEMADALPYTVILVRLAEGPLLYSNLIEEPSVLPVPGTPVRAVLDPLGDTAALVRFQEISP